MHTPRAHCRDRGPGWIAQNVRGEILVDGDDDVRIPQQHLLDRDIGEAAARATGDVARDQFDRLYVDRAAEPGLEPARPAGVVDARPLLERNRVHALGDGLDGALGATGKGLALLAPSDQRTECAVGKRNSVET